MAGAVNGMMITASWVTPPQPEQSGGSHVLAYADMAGATEEHALYGTSDELCDALSGLSAVGVEYVLVNLAGGAEQLRRFSDEVMSVVSGR